MTWASSVPILVFLGLSVLELCPMYATESNRRQTDRRQTKASLNASALWGRKHNNDCSQVTSECVHKLHRKKEITISENLRLLGPVLPVSVSVMLVRNFCRADILPAASQQNHTHWASLFLQGSTTTRRWNGAQHLFAPAL